MLYVSIIAFALAAVFGVTILLKWAGNSDAPRVVVYSHGLLAATGLILLLIAALNNKDNAPVVSIVLFLIAAIAGFYMFFTDLVKKKRSLITGVVHGIVAVIGFVLLLLFVFK